MSINSGDKTESSGKGQSDLNCSTLRASRKTMLAVVLLISVGAVVTFMFWLSYNQYNHQFLADKVRKDASVVKREVASFRNVLDLLATNPLVVGFDLKTGTSAQKMLLLSYLQNLKTAVGITAAYILDEHGTCIISSNRSFEGKNYAFRSYFKKAVKGGWGYELAFGVTSQKIGLYLSQRIEHGAGMGGIAVLKLDPLIILAVVEENHSHIVSGGDEQVKVPLVSLVSPSGVMVSNELPGKKVLDSQVISNLVLVESRQFDISFIEELGFAPGTWENLHKNKYYKSNGYDLFLKEVIADTLYFFHSFSPAQSHVAGEGISLINRTMGMLAIFFLLALFPLIIFAFSLDRQRFRLEKMGHELSRTKRLKDENEFRYQSVIENHNQGFWTMSLDADTIDSVNKALCDMLDLSAGELLFKSPAELVIDDDVSMIREIFKRSKEDYSFTTTLIGANNKMVPVHIDSWLVRDGEGNPLFRYCFVDDLSREMLSLNKIRLLEAVVEQAPSSIVITDVKGGIQYVNPAFSKVTGYSLEEVIGGNPRVLKSGKLAEDYYQNMWQVLSSGEIWRGRFCNQTKSGSLYWEESVIAPVRDDDGIIDHYVAIKNDITEKVILEDKLKQKFTERELIVKHAGAGILYIKKDRIVELNERAAGLLSVDKDKFVSKNVRDLLLSEDEYKRFLKICLSDLRAGKTVEFDQERVTGNGEKIWLRGIGRAVDNDLSGKGVIWIIQDMTRVYREKQQLETKRQDAEEASNAKTMFLANMSHEIRTPMNAIIGMTRLVAETDLNSEQERYVARIATSSRILLDILNDILDFSKIEAGQLSLEKRPFLREQLLDSIHSMMVNLAEKKGLFLEITCDPDVPDAFVGDMSRLVQVLVNLVGNAIKFTEQGRVTVRVSLPEQDPGRDESVLSFSVADSGIGIAADKISNLFQEFQQADSSVSRRFGGTGLGLAISRKLVQLMGGDIEVASREGIGSTFSFTIELKTCAVEEVSAQFRGEDDRINAIRGKTSDRLRILLVDDNEVNCELATIVLERLGHTVFLAKNGLNALEMLGEEGVDLIFMDIQMPEMDGITATRVIRAVEEERELPVILPRQLYLKLQNRLADRHVPVIAMTAHALESDRQRCLAVGMDDYLTKPFYPEQMEAVLFKFGRAINDNSIEEDTRGHENNEEGNRKKGKENVLADSGDDTVLKVKKHLADIYGLEDIQIKELLASSSQSLNSNLEKAQICLTNDELKMLAVAVHALRGNLLNLGLTEPASIAAKIETAAETGESQPYGQWLAEIRAGVKDLLETGGVG